VRPLALDTSKKLLAVDTGHPKITHDDVIALSSESFEGLLSVRRSLDVIAILVEQDGEQRTRPDDDVAILSSNRDTG